MISRPILLACLALALSASACQDSGAYEYHRFKALGKDLVALEARAPALVELTTAQEAFGLPLIPHIEGGLPIYLLRLTQESSGLDKPEVLIVAGQHGNESVGPEAALALAEVLVDRYGSDPWLTALLERREIYLVPAANPYGLMYRWRYTLGIEGAIEDMNRDHPYDRDPCDFGCMDEDPLSTVGGQALHELGLRHPFRVVLDLHGGAELLVFPWGTPGHASPEDISPDHQAAESLGRQIAQFAGPYSQTWPVGTANALLGPVYGPFDDTSYALGWEVDRAPAYLRSTIHRAIAYTIEISDQKRPEQDTLGTDLDLLTPGGEGDGYVPKTVRALLAAIDSVEPYLLWQEAPAPATVVVGSTRTYQWEVRGCLQVEDTHLRLGPRPDLTETFIAESPPQQALEEMPCLEPPRAFQASLTFDTPGSFYVAPVARVDQALLEPSADGPSPESWFVRSRLEEGAIFGMSLESGEVNTVVGRRLWQGEARQITVLED